TDTPYLLDGYGVFFKVRQWSFDSSKSRIRRIVIMESLVKKKQKGGILELKRRHLKNNIFCTYTPYPAMKIRRISASSAQETRNDQFSIWRIHYSIIRRMHSCSSVKDMHLI
ncbi:hypothetical protein Tco_1359115, partial [Tanacetum coccineum]